MRVPVRGVVAVDNSTIFAVAFVTKSDTSSLVIKALAGYVIATSPLLPTPITTGIRGIFDIPLENGLTKIGKSPSVP